MRRHRMVQKKEEVQVPMQQEVSGDEELSNAITFLNSLQQSQPLQFYEEMIDDMTFVERINPRHVKPTLTTDELKNMTGHENKDGKFYCFFYYSYNFFGFRCSFCQVDVLFDH
jgi:hypothetical protein